MKNTLKSLTSIATVASISAMAAFEISKVRRADCGLRTFII